MLRSHLRDSKAVAAAMYAFALQAVGGQPEWTHQTDEPHDMAPGMAAYRGLGLESLLDLPPEDVPDLMALAMANIRHAGFRGILETGELISTASQEELQFGRGVARTIVYALPELVAYAAANGNRSAIWWSDALKRLKLDAPTLARSVALSVLLIRAAGRETMHEFLTLFARR